MSKSPVMVVFKDAVNGCWSVESIAPQLIVSSYSFFGIDFSSNGTWDMHNKEAIR